MVNESYRQELTGQRDILEKENVISNMFNTIARQRGIEIPKELVDFMRLVVDQSLEFRQNEWAVYPASAVPLIVTSALGNVMRGSVSYRRPEGKPPVLSLTSVLENIRNQWCGIYPIC